MPPPRKRKRTTSEVISFDKEARISYLTEFHKRKVERTKKAREEAAKRTREEKVKERKELRDSRKEGLRKHVEAIQVALRPIDQLDEGTEGESEGQPMSYQYDIHHHDEYVDEERFTTVTVEPIDFDKNSLDGFEGQVGDANAEQIKAKEERNLKNTNAKEKRKKFTYLSKAEMKETRRRIKATKLRRGLDAKKARDGKSRIVKGKGMLKRR